MLDLKVFYTQSMHIWSKTNLNVVSVVFGCLFLFFTILIELQGNFENLRENICDCEFSIAFCQFQNYHKSKREDKD